jgi:hypothetical protein
MWTLVLPWRSIWMLGERGVSMATIAAPLEAPRMTAGRVLDRAIATVRHKPLFTVAFAFLFGAIPVVAFDFLLEGIDRSALVLTIAGRALPGFIALTLLQLFVGLVVGVVMQGAMVAPVLAEEQGLPLRYGSVLASLLRSLPSLVGLGLLIGVAVDIGITLFIVPAVVIYLLWSVAPSAVAAEGEGVFMALNRSQELTAGARWKIFAVLLLLEVANLILGIGAVFLAVRVFGFSPQLQTSVGYVVTLGLVNTLSCLMWAAVQASLYVELVQWKEGNSPENLAEVFA